MTTLLDARNYVRMRCDQQVTSGTPFVSDAELNWYLNSSRAEHYDLITSLYEDYNLSSAVQTVTAPAFGLTLPSDLYKLRGVDLALNQAGSQWATLERYNFRDRNQASALSPAGYWQQAWGPARKYRLQGQTVLVMPFDNAAGTYQLWYTPQLTDLVADTDAFTPLGHWEEEYAVTDACIKVLAKEESDTSNFVGQKAALIARIQHAAKTRDAGAPETIQSTRTRQYGFGHGQGGY